MNKLQLAMNAGARAIETTKRLDGATYVYDLFSDNPQEISYREASQILREGSESGGWIPVSERLPECEYGYESEEILYQLKNTGSIEVGYYGCGGKYRDKYFRHKRDSGEGVDVSDVIAWQPLPEPYREEGSK